MLQASLRVRNERMWIEDKSRWCHTYRYVGRWLSMVVRMSRGTSPCSSTNFRSRTLYASRGLLHVPRNIWALAFLSKCLAATWKRIPYGNSKLIKFRKEKACTVLPILTSTCLCFWSGLCRADMAVVIRATIHNAGFHFKARDSGLRVGSAKFSTATLLTNVVSSTFAIPCTVVGVKYVFVQRALIPLPTD